ncbi:hypothetical protein GJAV_G00275640 [Gymnothorax javanicus]|nr:hypothetical protein GJAV_G00275640 [Gymnothorax javanicus]
MTAITSLMFTIVLFTSVKVRELGARKMPNALPRTEIIMERLSGVSEIGELLKKTLGSSAEMHRKMDAVLSQCGEFVRLTVNLGKRQDEMMGELVALKREVKNLQNE